MKLVGPDFLAAFGGRFINSHPALLPSFPGMHGVRDALGYGVKVTGCTIFLVDAGVDAGPVIAQAVRAGAATTTTRRPARADQGGRAGAAGGDRRPDGPRGLVRPGQESEVRRVITASAAGEPGSGEPDGTAGRRATGCRSAGRWSACTTRPAWPSWPAACTTPGVEIVSTGSTAAAIAAAGLPVTRVEDLTGFPECLDGRVKTLHPAVHAGLLADVGLPGHRRAARRARRRNRSSCSSPTSTRSRPRSPRGAGPADCVEQIDIGGPAMVRAAAKNHANVAVITEPAQYADGPGGGAARRVHGRAAPPPGRAGVRPHRRLRRGGGVLVRRRVRARRDRVRDGLAGRDRRALVAPQRAALRGEPAPAGRPLPAGRRRERRRRRRRRRAAARQGDVVQQLRGRRGGPAGRLRLHRAVRGGHQALQPVRHRGRRGRGRGAPQGARLRPGVRVRRGDRGERRRDGRAGQPDRRDLHRGAGRPGLRARARGDPHRPARTCGCCAARRRPPAERPASGARSTAACWSSPRTGWTRRATTRPAGS